MPPSSRLALIVVLAACERSGPPPPPREPPRPPVAFRERSPSAPAPTEAPQEAPRDDAGVPEVIARCVSRTRAALPPELAGALGALDAPALLEDGCRLDAAPRLRAPSLCDAIASSTLREACAARVAIATAAPERCPATPGLVGREPVCVAVAARSPALCAAAPGTDRGRCLALVHADARQCARLEGTFRTACMRDFAALAPWLEARRGDALVEASVSLALTDPTRDGGPEGPVWILHAHRRGAWLDEEGNLWMVDPALGWPRATSFAGDEPVVAVKVPTLGVAVGAEVAAEARVLLPDALALDTRDLSARATAVFARVPRARGDLYAVTVHISGARAGLARSLTVQGDGFVRDVVPATALRSW